MKELLGKLSPSEKVRQVGIAHRVSKELICGTCMIRQNGHLPFNGLTFWEPHLMTAFTPNVKLPSGRGGFHPLPNPPWITRSLSGTCRGHILYGYEWKTIRSTRLA